VFGDCGHGSLLGVGFDGCAIRLYDGASRPEDMA